METKEELTNKIIQWVQVDNEINQLTEKIKQIKSVLNEKKIIRSKYNNEIVEVMKNNTLTHINTNGGSIMYRKHKVPVRFSNKKILESLTLYFNDDEKAKEVSAHILENMGGGTFNEFIEIKPNK